MSVVIKKINFVFFVSSLFFVIPFNGYAQDLFDDSFLSNPDNKSITVEKNNENKTVAPIAIDIASEEKNSNVTEKENSVLDDKKTDAKEIVVDIGVQTTKEAVKANKNPIAQVTKEKISPSEKVIGVISQETFKTMADLEKENVLLNLQLKQEKLKNEIGSVKAQQRKAMMEEIEKRELAARSRIEWEKQQEIKEIEIWEKRQKAELLAKQVEDIISGKAATEAAAAGNTIVSASGEVVEVEEILASDIYYILEIRGISENLTAKLADNEEKKVFFVKEGSFLPTGHKVVAISKDHVKLTLDDKEELIGFSVTQEN